MASLFAHKKIIISTAIFLVGLFLMALRPASSEASPVVFEVKPGDSFLSIVFDLKTAGLVRSQFATAGVAILKNQIRALKPGRYELHKNASAIEILNILVTGSEREVVLAIPEGSSIYEIDHLLSEAGILPKGALLLSPETNEGYLFPDTYRFFLQATTTEVLAKFQENFNQKIQDLLPKDEKEARRILILASLIEKEVPALREGRIVAGVFEKRLKAKMPLQVDATLCYAKLREASDHDLPFAPCTEVRKEDKAIDSAYNTYRYAGLPPGPITSPSRWAVEAALDTEPSAYWFYITDPKTRKTIFAATLEEQNKNIARYLR
ncbi:MAG: endolytic transglycosylase MltG [Patescibacteria group bacterium]